MASHRDLVFLSVPIKSPVARRRKLVSVLAGYSWRVLCRPAVAAIGSENLMPSKKKGGWRVIGSIQVG